MSFRSKTSKLSLEISCIMRKKVLIIALVIVFSCISVTRVIAQDNTFVIYYDSLWGKVPKENAFFYTQFTKRVGFYQCSSYWARSGKLFCTSAYADTAYRSGIGNFGRAIGTIKSYYENGVLSDSILADEHGGHSQQWHYNVKGIPELYTYYDKVNEKLVGQCYDSVGNKIPGYFTYQEVAKFPGGTTAWTRYLVSHLKIKIPALNKAPTGLYTVVVSFLVNKEGKIVEVKAENNPGFGTAEEAVRVIENGPSWVPAIQNDKPVIYRQRQSITFQVS
jgi:hypothetical protein